VSVLYIPTGNKLSITSTASSVGTYRKFTTDLETELPSVSIYPSTTIQLGPFLSDRIYVVTDYSGDITSTVSPATRQDNQLGTGLYTGGLVTASATPGKINIAAGTGILVDNYTNQTEVEAVRVSWQARTNVNVTYLNSTLTSYVAISKTGEIAQFNSRPTPDQRRDYIFLAIIVHTDLTTVQDVGNLPAPGYDHSQMLIDFCDALGIVNKSGNQFSANGANLKVNKSSGQSFFPGLNFINSVKAPNLTTDAAQVAPTMFRSYRNGSGGWAAPVLSDLIDVARYDNGTGTLASLSASDPFQIFRFWFAPSNGNIIVAYGQNPYKTIADAEAALTTGVFVQNPVLNDQSFRGWLIAKRDATSLSDATKSKFINAGSIGASAASGSSTATTNLQGAYNNSAEPEILTDSTHNALNMRDGTNVSTAKLISFQNFSATELAYINASGQFYGGITGGNTASRPGSPTTYQQYFDTTLGKPIWYNGGWKDSAGNSV